MERPRIIGIDYGTKRIGIAVSDPFRMFARPVGTYDAEAALVRIDELLSDPGADVIVVGWPLEEDGTEGPATRFVEPFIARLKKRFPSVQVVKWDERYSSESAKRALRDAGVRRKRRRERTRIDAAAAAIILQEYLDEMRT